MAAKQLTTRYMTQAQEAVLSSWRHLLIREFILLKDFQPNGEYISQKLNRIVSEKQADESLDLLARGGFARVKDSGEWELQDPVLSTGDSVFTHERMQKYHSELLNFWSENLHKFYAKEQELHLLNIPIASSKIPELQKRVREFQDEFLTISG